MSSLRPHAVAMLVALLLSSLAAAAEPALKLGMSAPLSGPQASYGKSLLDGAQACVAQANAAGGIQGRLVELVALDDAGQPARTLANTRALVADSNVVGLLGYVGADTTLAAFPLIAEARIALIGVASGDESLRATANEHVFHLRAGHSEEAAAIVTQLDHMGIARIAVVYEKSSLGEDGVAGADTEMVRLALRATARTQVNASGQNAAAAAREVAADMPSAVILIAGNAASVAFVRAMKALGQNPQYVAISETNGDLLLKNLGPALARGVGFSQVVPSPRNPALPLVRAYQAAMKAATVTELGTASLEGCIDAKVAVEALKRAGRGATRAQLEKGLLGGEIDVGGYRVRFNGNDRRGSAYTEMAVVGGDGRIKR